MVSGLDAPQPSAALLHVESGSKSAFRLTLAVIGAYAALGLVILPFAAVPGPAIPGLSTFFAAGVFVTELSTGFLLFVRFRETRAPSILLLACAYLYSALMAIAYLLTFTDAIVRGASILGTPQSTAWIFVIWVFGFALLTLSGVILEAWYRHIKNTAPGKRDLHGCGCRSCDGGGDRDDLDHAAGVAPAADRRARLDRARRCDQLSEHHDACRGARYHHVCGRRA